MRQPEWKHVFVVWLAEPRGLWKQAVGKIGHPRPPRNPFQHRHHRRHRLGVKIQSQTGVAYQLSSQKLTSTNSDFFATEPCDAHNSNAYEKCGWEDGKDALFKQQGEVEGPLVARSEEIISHIHFDYTLSHM